MFQKLSLCLSLPLYPLVSKRRKKSRTWVLCSLTSVFWVRVTRWGTQRKQLCHEFRQKTSLPSRSESPLECSRNESLGPNLQAGA